MKAREFDQKFDEGKENNFKIPTICQK